MRKTCGNLVSALPARVATPDKDLIHQAGRRGSSEGYDGRLAQSPTLFYSSILYEFPGGVELKREHSKGTPLGRVLPCMRQQSQSLYGYLVRGWLLHPNITEDRAANIPSQYLWWFPWEKFLCTVINILPYSTNVLKVPVPA